LKLVHGHLPIDAPAGVQGWDIDPYSPEVQADPVPYYAQLRERGPFSYLTRYSMLACGRYDVVREVFSDHGRFVSSRGVGVQDFALEEPWRPHSIILEVDPPYHNRTRRVLMRALSPKAVADLRAYFLDEARDLVSDLVAQGEFEAVEALAETYPTRVFPKAVGMKLSDRRKLVDHGSMVFNALGPDNAQRQTAMAMGPEIIPWVMEQCKRENLTDDGIGAAIYASADEELVSEAEAGMLVRSLLSAGIDTTVTGIGNAVWTLSQNPEQFAALRADPSLAMGAFDETMRLTSPVAAFCRTACVDTEVAGIKIAEGTKILCVLGAANLDSAKFEEAERFDIKRKTAGHLALGVGVHMCVGQNIARAEGQAILTAIAEQVGVIEPAGDAVWRPNNAMHALESLPVRFG
jgi:4-methoxybenzoate monooxygenase (O-demethylating)